MNKEKELQLQYAATRTLIDATEKTIENPDKSVVDYLAEGDEISRKMSFLLAASGASALPSTISSLETISASGAKVLKKGQIRAKDSGIFEGGVGTVLNGSVGLHRGFTTLFLYILIKIIKWVWPTPTPKSEKKKKEKKVKGKKASEEKTALLKEIIAKQQAVIDKQSKMISEQDRQIRNLEEAMRILKEAQASVENDFAYV